MQDEHEHFQTITKAHAQSCYSALQKDFSNRTQKTPNTNCQRKGWNVYFKIKHFCLPKDITERETSDRVSAYNPCNQQRAEVRNECKLSQTGKADYPIGKRAKGGNHTLHESQLLTERLVTRKTARPEPQRKKTDAAPRGEDAENRNGPASTVRVK